MKIFLNFFFFCLLISSKLFSGENTNFHIVQIECDGYNDTLEQLTNHPNPVRVQEMYFYGNSIVNGEILQCISDNFPNVTILGIQNFNESEKINSTQLFFPSVIHLFIGNDSQALNLAAACPNLMNLDISLNKNDPCDELIAKFSEKCPLLKCLVVLDQYPYFPQPLITDRTLQELTLFAKNLECFHVGAAASFSGEAIKNFLSIQRPRMFFYLPRNSESNPISIEEVVELADLYSEFQFLWKINGKEIIVRKNNDQISVDFPRYDDD